MSRERIYISGPVTGRPFGEALEHFAREERRLQVMGFHTVNPLRMRLCVWLASRYGGERERGGRGWGYRACLLLELLWMALTCHGVYMLTGHGGSMGARAELALAEAAGMTVMHEGRAADGRRRQKARKDSKNDNRRRNNNARYEDNEGNARGADERPRRKQRGAQ